MRDNNFRPRVSPEELHKSGLCRFLRMKDQIELSISAFAIGLVDVDGVKHVLMVYNSEEHRLGG